MRTTTTAPKIQTGSPLVAVMFFRSGVRDGIDCPSEAPSVGNLSHRAGCALGHTVAKISRRAA